MFYLTLTVACFSLFFRNDLTTTDAYNDERHFFFLFLTLIINEYNKQSKCKEINVLTVKNHSFIFKGTFHFKNTLVFDATKTFLM